MSNLSLAQYIDDPLQNLSSSVKSNLLRPYKPQRWKVLPDVEQHKEIAAGKINKAAYSTGLREPAINEDIYPLRDELWGASPTARVKPLVHAGPPALLDTEEERWFRQNMDMLLRKHKGQFVAICGNTILGYAKDRRTMALFLDQKIGPMAGAFVARVTPDAFSDEDPTPYLDKWEAAP